MKVTDLTMTFYSPVRREIAVRSAAGQVFKTTDGCWRAWFAVRLADEYAGLAGDHYYREEKLLPTRGDALRTVKGWCVDHLGGFPEGLAFLLEKRELPLTAELDPARPYGRKERAA